MASESQPAKPAPYREFTWAAFLLGIVQGIILNIAFVYVALKLGFSLGGSTVAAIMGYAVLRGVMKKGTIVENNLNQTIASGINTAGTGVVFTLPALFMLNEKWLSAGEAGIDIQLIPLAIAGMAGAVLGVIVIIPLRKQMIELEQLRFPTGVATATILRAGATGIEKAKLLAIGIVVSAAWKLVIDSGMLTTVKEGEALLFGINGEELHFNFGVIPEYFSPVLYLSLMNIAAGMLAGKSGLPFVAGGALAWWVIAPASVALGWVPASGGDTPVYADTLYSWMLRPLGIGVLIGGALMSVVTSFPAIKSAFRSLATAAKTAGVGGVKSDEMNLRTLIIGSILSVALFFTASLFTSDISVGQAALSAIVGTLWLGIAALIVAQATGMTDISPMSGMALISVTLMMFLLNSNVAGAMIVGVAVCVAIGQGADMMQDLKTGHMVGARPVKQQVAQFFVTWIGPLVAIGVIYILWSGGPDGKNGIGGKALPAPQSTTLMGIIDAVKNGTVPVDKYAMGGIVGAVLGAAPASGLGVLVGLAMYLPFSITMGYGVGCFIQMGIKRVKGVAFVEHKLVPLAAGLIVGEALAGVSNSLYKIMTGP